MFRKFFENKRKQRFERMEAKLPYLPDEELKQWYCHADMSRVMGDMCQHESNLFVAIEEELVKRGFEHMVDF